VKSLSELHSSSRLLDFPDVRQREKWLTVTNTLVYYDIRINTAVKSIIVQAPDPNVFKTFLTVWQNKTEVHFYLGVVFDSYNLVKEQPHGELLHTLYHQIIKK
jgi:hypothetical protein